MAEDEHGTVLASVNYFYTVKDTMLFVEGI